MFIQTEETPNPATLKFLPGTPVMQSGTADFPSADAASRSPLATRLFAIEGVVGVFLGADFITVAKAQDQEWHIMKPQILGAVMDHMTTGLPVIEEGATEETNSQDDNETVRQIKELLDTRVRPAVAMDGGDIVYHSFEEGVVYLHMRGACAGCPSSTMTLKVGIENMLRHFVPEVQRVEAVA